MTRWEGRCRRAAIEQLFAAGAAADKDAARDAFAALRQALGAGEVRAAEPDASQPTGWRVNPWVKQGILLGFRFGDIVDLTAGLPFYDKDTMPLKRPGPGAGIRIVPGGSQRARRRLPRPGVICMPPMYVNIGAYVGQGTLIDSHALVGSCAQVGARVHVSAAAQLGGVIEPVGALPVIVEDDVLVGGNTGIYEGAVIKTPRGHRGGHHPHRLDAGLRPAAWRASSSRSPGSRSSFRKAPWSCRALASVTVGAGRDWGLSLATPVIVKYRDDRTDTRTELEVVDPVDPIALARQLIDIDSTTGREGEAAHVLAAFLRDRGYSVLEQPLDRTTTRLNVIAAVGEPLVVLSTHIDCVPPFFPSRLEDGVLYGRGACDAKGILAAQVAAADRMPSARRHARGPGLRGGRRARQRGRDGGQPHRVA